MRIQIVAPDGEIITTKRGLELEAEIPSHKTISRFRPFARRRRKVLLTDLVILLSHLRDETRFA